MKKDWEEKEDVDFLIKRFLPDEIHYILDSGFCEKEKRKIIEEHARRVFIYVLLKIKVTA